MSSSQHHSQHDSRSQKTVRLLLSFILFIALSALSLSGCLRIFIANPDNIETIFTDAGYVNALSEDVLTYAKDECLSVGLPSETVENCINYKTVYEIQSSYIRGAFGDSNDVTATTYLDYIEDLQNKLEASAKKAVKDYSLNVDPQVKNGEKIFAENICEYLKSRVEFKYMDKLSPIVSVVKSASLVSIIVSAVAALLLIPVVASIGHKKYRALRYVAYSFSAAALLEIVLVLGVQIVKSVKDLVLYPMYFTDSIMGYINKCEISVLVSAGLMFVLSTIVSTAVWKIKRDNS